MPGVYVMGTTGGFGAVRERVPGGGGRPATRGVKAEVGDVQTAVDLRRVSERIAQLADISVTGVELQVQQLHPAHEDRKRAGRAR